MFFKRSQVWVVDFTYDGHPRRWVRALPQHKDARAELASMVHDYYGRRGNVVEIRLATPEEETQYIHDDVPANVLCPTGRRPAQSDAGE